MKVVESSWRVFLNSKEIISHLFKVRAKNFWFALVVASLLCFGVSAVCGVPTVHSSPAISSLPRLPQQRWNRREVSGISYEIAMDMMHGREGVFGSHRVIYVYLEAGLFSKNNVLTVFKDISSKTPLPTTIYATLLTDRDSLEKRVKEYTGWETSNDNSYTRLTDNTDSACCPQDFTGAQFDRYISHARFVLCTSGQKDEIVAEIDKKLPRRRSSFLKKRSTP